MRERVEGVGRLRVTEKEGEINEGRGEGGEEESKGQEGGEGGGRGKLEDCVPLARCSARGGLLPLEPARGGEKSGGGRKRGRG